MGSVLLVNIYSVTMDMSGHIQVRSFEHPKEHTYGIYDKK